MIKTMVTTRRIRVWYNLKNKSYRIRIENLELKITPQLVLLDTTPVAVPIAVGELARLLYTSLRQHNHVAFRKALIQILPVAKLFS